MAELTIGQSITKALEKNSELSRQVQDAIEAAYIQGFNEGSDQGAQFVIDAIRGADGESALQLAEQLETFVREAKEQALEAAQESA